MAYTFHRTEILKHLYELATIASKNRFISTRPTSLTEQVNDFVVIRIPQAIRQNGAYHQYTVGQFACFVRDKQGSIENSVKLEEMTDALAKLFPIITDLFTASRPRLLFGGSDGAGFHYLTLQFEIQISD